MLIWCDVETTGLLPEKHHLLEVGLIATTDDLRTEQGRISFVIEQPISVASLINESDEFVQEMHTQNGLWGDLRKLNHKIDSVETKLMDWLIPITRGVKYPLCGNSVSFDRGWLRCRMPRLEALFHYRNIDVSTLKEMYNRLTPDGIPYPKDSGSHRVLEDLDQSIAEMRFYLQKTGWLK